MGHVFEGIVNDAYIFSEAVVSMDSKRPLEKSGQLLVGHLELDSVKQDKSLSTFSMCNFRSPYVRSSPIDIDDFDDSSESSQDESEKKPEIDSDDEEEKHVGMKRAIHQRQINFKETKTTTAQQMPVISKAGGRQTKQVNSLVASKVEMNQADRDEQFRRKSSRRNKDESIEVILAQDMKTNMKQGTNQTPADNKNQKK